MQRSDRTATAAPSNHVTEFPADPAKINGWIQDHFPLITRLAEGEQRRLKLPPDICGEIANETVVVLLTSKSTPTSNCFGWLRSCVRTAANRVGSSYGRSRCGRARANGFDAPSAIKEAGALATIDRGPERVDARDILECLDPLVAEALWSHTALGMTQAAVAKKWGWSRQRFNRLVSRSFVLARSAVCFIGRA